MNSQVYLFFRKLFLVALLTGLVACEKETIHKTKENGWLKEIRSGDKIHQQFIYKGESLVEEKWFGFECKDNPTDVFAYIYQQGKITSLQVTLRSLYSSTAALCDPATGIHSEENFEYDAQGRLSKTVRNTSYTIYTYNANGFIEKQTIHSTDGTVQSTTSFRYDAKGNIVQEIDTQGNSTQYQYDDQPNPFYLINQRPGWISAFNKSPNNVLKVTGAVTFDRTIEYFPNGLPRRVLENGVYYTYHYE
jgi:hypothetical protein